MHDFVCRIINHVFLLLIFSLTANLLPAYSTIDLGFINSKWGFIDRNGDVVVEPVYSRVEDFSEGLAAVKVDGTHVLGGKWGFIDHNGRVVIEPRFEQARSFREGLAAVELDGKWGATNTSGTLVVAPQHAALYDFHEGLAPFVESTGETPASPKRELWGYLDSTGRIVITPQFDSASFFSEGLAAVSLPGASHNRSAGYIDRTGRVVIAPRFDLAFPFSEGFAAVQLDRKIGYIDRAGRLIIPANFFFSWQQNFRDGLANVAIDESRERYALIDKQGTIVRRLPRRYTSGVLFNPADGSLTGLHSEKTSNLPLQAPFTAEQAYSSEGMVPVFQNQSGVNSIGGSLFGFADLSGRLVIPPKFEHVGDFHEGRAKFAVNIDWAAAQADDSYNFQPPDQSSWSRFKKKLLGR